MAKLFIVGFPKDIEEMEVVEMFGVYETVNTVTIVTDKESDQSKGYGFITMTDDAGADRAIAALDGAEIDDRKISVRIAEEKNPGKAFDNSTIKKPFVKRDNRTETPKPKRPRRSI